MTETKIERGLVKLLSSSGGTLTVIIAATKRVSPQVCVVPPECVDDFRAALCKLLGVADEPSRQVKEDVAARLAAMTSARDEACEIADEMLDEHLNDEGIWNRQRQRIVELRKVGGL